MYKTLPWNAQTPILAQAEDFEPGLIKIIAALELVSGLMVIVPRLLWHGRYFTFMGAATIALIMIGSTLTHIRRKEFQHAIINLVFLLMAVFVLWVI